MEQEEQANYKIGNIYKRGKIFKSWNKRSIVLNFIKRTLSLRKGTTSKEKVMNLENCEVVWVGNFKSKVFYFKVKIVKNFAQEKYKRMNLGDTDERNARMWMEQIEKIINQQYQVQIPLEKNIQPKNSISSSTAKDHALLPMNQGSEKQSTKVIKEVKFSEPENGRQILSINKDEDYDQLIKQFESCCYYAENNASEYDEWKPHERGVILPVFNATYRFQSMPDTIQDNPDIEIIVQNSPESIREEVSVILEAYFKKPQYFIQSCISLINCPEVEKNIYFKDNCTFLIKEVVDMTPLEIYEELQTPSTKEHWNEVMDSYIIQPADERNDEIRNLSLISYKFKFQKADGSFDPKEIISYRYSIQFSGAYFIWEFQHLQNKIDQDIENNLPNKVNSSIVILSDLNRKNVSYICYKSTFNFKNEPKELQLQNTRRFLRGFENVQKCIDGEHKSDNIIVECNAEHEDAEEEDEIDSHVFISVRIDRPITVGNAEVDFSDEQLVQILVNLANKSFIRDCVKAKHERRIVSGVYPLVKTSKEKGHYCWKFDYKRDEKKGGLVYYNEKLVKEQRSVIMSIVKRIGSNFLNGKSIMNISMPVQIFDSKSMIQRLAKGFGHAPAFLEKAGLVNSIKEQIKYAGAFLLSTFIMGITQEKPFNPVIGETVQARLNGCPIYFEQTSHHPAICNYLMYGRGYDLYGCHIPMVSMGPNSLSGSLSGNPIIHLKNTNVKLYCIWNSFTVYNLTFGQRSLNATGRAYVFEPKSCIALELIFNPNNASGISSLFSKKFAIDEVSGAIYQLKPEAMQKLIQGHKIFNKKNDLALDPQKDVLSLLSKAEGIWNSYLEFDGVKYWDDTKDFPYICEYEINPLPSDSRYREDLLYFLKNEKKTSQDKKEEMEEAQRHDQKLRDVNKQKKNKKGK